MPIKTSMVMAAMAGSSHFRILNVLIASAFIILVIINWIQFSGGGWRPRAALSQLEPNSATASASAPDPLLQLQLDNHPPPPKFTTRTKLILLYTPSFYGEGLPGWAIFNNTLDLCPYKCEFTANRADHAEADAVVYHATPKFASEYPLPSQLRPNPQQIWIFFRLESPVYEPFELTPFNGVFNWTMTYRKDSDVPWPAAGVARLPASKDSSKFKIPATAAVATSTSTSKKLPGRVGWMNSHCKTASRREAYAAELEKYVPIDNYGGCGDPELNCSSSAATGPECYGLLGRQYKYWLAFENSICEDYVTEKLYNPLRAGILPIVFGDSGTYRELAAAGLNGAFIDVMDFSTAKDLADHLLYLDRNDTAYQEYFNWKREYRILSGLENINANWCRLCTKLHKQGQLSHGKGQLDGRPAPRWNTLENLQDWYEFKNGGKKPKHVCAEVGFGEKGQIRLYDLILGSRSHGS